MSDDDAALRGETAKLIKELGLADFQFDDEEDDKQEKKAKANKKKQKDKQPTADNTKSQPPVAAVAKVAQPKPADAKKGKTAEKGKVAENGKKDVKVQQTGPKKDVKLQEAAPKKDVKVQKAAPVAAPNKSNGKQGSQKQPSAAPAAANGSSKSAAGSGGAGKAALPTWLGGKGKGKPVEIKAPDDGHWYDALSAIKDSGRFPRVDPSVLSAVCDTVQDKFEAEVARFHEQRTDSNDADSKWLREVIQSGTLSDRVAALAMQVQRSPLHHLRALDTMMDMCCKKEQRVAQLAIEATKDLLMHNLLPDRPLVPFASRNLFAPEMNMNLAVLCWYEGELSHRVARFVGALEAGSMVNADYFKKICLDVSVELLVTKPEQEARHLALIVNKLGDPSPPICQKAMESLKRVVHAHPAMTPVVIKEIRNFISRPHLAVRALFSSILFLSQVPLRGNSAVAAQLVECYVSLFESAVQREESGSRLLYALLTGINRAFPFLTDREPILRHLDALFRIVHSAAFTTSTQALMLISYIALADENSAKKKKGPETPAASESEQSLVTRFYRALYDKLLSSELSTRARNTLFLNLLFRSMKRDPSVTRMMAFVKRLMICVTQCSSNIAAGLIFLLAEVSRHRPEALSMLTAPEAISSAAPAGAEEIHAFGNFNVDKREPMYAVPAGSTPALWEASLMRQHFHPSVKAFTNSWLSPPDHSVKFDGDPITEFSVSAFLNRFSYKNPKTRNMEKVHRPLPKAEDPVNSEMFIGASEDSISPDKAFFHKYFGARIRLLGEGKLKDRSHRKREDGESGDEEGSGAEDGAEEREPAALSEEAEIDKYADSLAEQLMKSAEGSGFDRADIDDDLDFSSDSDSSGDEAASGQEDLFEGEEEELDADDVDGYMRAGGSDEEDLAGDSDESDGDDGMDFNDFSDEDMSEMEEEAPAKKGKGKKRKASDDVFASAEDYALDMEEIMQQVTNEVAEDEVDNNKRNKKNKKPKLDQSAPRAEKTSAKPTKAVEVVGKQKLRKGSKK